MPCNLSSSRVNGTEFSDLAQTDQTHGIQYKRYLMTESQLYLVSIGKLKAA